MVVVNIRGADCSTANSCSLSVARTMARTITYLQVTMTLRQQIEPRKTKTLTLTVPTLQLQTCAKCFHFVYSQETTILPGCQWRSRPETKLGSTRTAVVVIAV